MATCSRSCRSLGTQCLYQFKPWITHRSFIFRQYHAVTSNTTCLSGTFWKSHERTNRTLTKNYFSNKPQAQWSVHSVVVWRGPFEWISKKIKLFLVNSYFDADFDEETFLEGTKQAIITVSALVCERKFNKLQGLLTSEAIENLKDEMLNNVESYRITMDDILQTNIHDIGFQYDEAEKSKKWLHITVSYIVQGVQQKQVVNTMSVRIPLPRIIRLRFCKECTAEVEDDWIITQVINFKETDQKQGGGQGG